MKIHVISTINGQKNEGMRNIATHLAREWEKSCTVRYSALKDIPGIIKSTRSSDATVLFARAGKAAYHLLGLLCLLCKNVWMVCVQEPDGEYRRLCKKKAPGNHYFALLMDNLNAVRVKNGREAVLLRVGIDEKKFVPVTAEEAAKLKQEYGFSPDKTLVVHVGHCSAGRGLELFAELTDDSVERLVVVSGMFEDEHTKELLQRSGVRVLSGYLPDVEKIYQMADVYLFPTKSAEHVINIPLSIMEALACGTPVAACSDLPGLRCINAVNEAVRIVPAGAELNGEIQALRKMKASESLLSEPISWSDSAAEALSAIRKNLK